MKYYTLETKNQNMTKYGEIASGCIIEKKSKFYSYIFCINSEKDALEYIDTIRRENKEARHVVYIYSYLDENRNKCIRYSDDGEPQGTGTKAIYELIEKENITNVCIVIVRYFGGILLGAGPLSRAYLNTVRNAIDNTIKKDIYNYIKKEIVASYNEYNILEDRLKEYISKDIVIIKEKEFNENVKITLLVVDEYYNEIEKIIKEISYVNS